MNDERYDLITDLIEHYEADARRLAETSQQESGSVAEWHKQKLYAVGLTNRIEFLLEEISIHSPALFAELAERMKQKEAA